jgi:HrpA-like RNA helicase
MYTLETFESLVENTEPEILRCNLSGIIINLKAMGLSDVFTIDFIDKPSLEVFISSFN